MKNKRVNHTLRAKTDPTTVSTDRTEIVEMVNKDRIEAEEMVNKDHGEAEEMASKDPGEAVVEQTSAIM